MSDDNHQEKKQQEESTEEFCARLGIKLVRGKKGGQQFAPYPGGNLLHKRLELAC